MILARYIACYFFMVCAWSRSMVDFSFTGMARHAGAILHAMGFWF
jgi:hypothetical protein